MRAKGNLFWIFVLLAGAAALAYWESRPVPADEPAPAQAPLAPVSTSAPSAPSAPAPAPQPSSLDSACMQQAEQVLRAQPLPSRAGQPADSAASRFRRYQQALSRCSRPKR